MWQPPSPGVEWSESGAGSDLPPEGPSLHQPFCPFGPWARATEDQLGIYDLLDCVLGCDHP